MQKKYWLSIVTLLHIKLFSSYSNSNDYPVITKEEVQVNDNSKKCFCAWCHTCTEPSCCPTTSDCRFYRCCKPCVSISDRLQSNCNPCGKWTAVACCPCVVQMQE